ncbi:MAG: glycosyltransferase family 2 protein [Paludibacter sp.]
MDKTLKITQSKVSILIPVYNVELFIERCANSLFSQTYHNIEFIFVNDCTPDNSMQLLRKVIPQYPNRKDQILIVNHAENKGIGQTRNSLLSSATGDYLMWVDSDDFITVNAVEILVSAIEDSGADIVTSDSYIFYKGEQNQKRFSQHFPEDSKQYIEAIAGHQARAALWGTLSKRSLWIENEITILKSSTYGEDYFATVQLFYFANKIKVIHSPFYYYNLININSYTTGYKSKNQFKSLVKLFDNLLSFFKMQNAVNEYNMFFNKARITEFSGLLLHTTSDLRRKYSYNIEIEELRQLYSEVDLTLWQYFLLKQIVLKRYLFSDLLLILAKVLRSLFGLKF